MKKLSLLLLTFAITNICFAAILSLKPNSDIDVVNFTNEPGILPNSETAEIETKGKIKIYKYKDYVITTESGDEPGDKIIVEIKGNPDKIELTAMGENALFYGVYKGHVFMKNLGQGNIWGLAAYNIAEGDMNYYIDAQIGDNGAQIKGDKLVFWKATTEAPESARENCTKVKEIEEADMYLIFQQKFIFDFSSNELKETFEYDCCGSTMI